MSTSKSISILGAGWLGKAFADTLASNQQWKIRLSTTSEPKMKTLQQAGYEAFCLSLDPQPKGSRQSWKTFLQSDYLLLNIPPQTRQQGNEFHPKQIRHLLKMLPKSCQVIFISSTSVYPNSDGWVSEGLRFGQETAENPAIWEAEQLLQKHLEERVNILRCGGLMGYDRIPGRYFAGQKDLKTGDIPVNFVHRDDVIGVILHLLQHPEVKGEVFNVVAPEHPLRRVVYKANAEAAGFEAPTFLDVSPRNYKIVQTHKILTQLAYEFKYPNPLEFSYDI